MHVILFAIHVLHAFVRTTSDEGVPLSWRTDPPAVEVDRAVPGMGDGGRSAIATASKAWSDASRGSFHFRTIRGRSPNRLRWVPSDAWKHGPDDAAYTTLDVDVSSGRIRGFVIELNGAKVPGVSLEAVLLHEVGHGLGLSHSFAKRAVMNGGIGPVPKTALESDDVAGLLAIYTIPLPETSPADLRVDAGVPRPNASAPAAGPPAAPGTTSNAPAAPPAEHLRIGVRAYAFVAAMLVVCGLALRRRLRRGE